MISAECQSLPPLENGHIVSSTGNRTNDTVTVKCSEGFVLSGSATRTCQKNGQWSGTLAHCSGWLIIEYKVFLYEE